MITEYYMDESGNTGDLTTVSIDAYFTEQRMFALAAFGLQSDSGFFDEVIALKAKHKIQGQEIKSTKTYNKPKFTLDLITAIESHDQPVFIEIVDKHFFVVINLIGRMIVPSLGELDYQASTMKMKSVMAQYTALYMPPELAYEFAACCQTRDHSNIISLYRKIIQWADTSPVNRQISKAIAQFARESLGDFTEMEPTQAVDTALPIPDANQYGKLMWLLPNVTSFTNIYARINQYASKNIAEVTLYHDEQLQFGEAILKNKNLAEGLVANGVTLPLRTADFSFSATANLKFLKSEESIGIQVADVLAGFITRYVQEKVWGQTPIHPDKALVFHKLMALANSKKGTGINLVAPDSLIQYLGIIPQSNF